MEPTTDGARVTTTPASPRSPTFIELPISVLVSSERLAARSATFRRMLADRALAEQRPIGARGAREAAVRLPEADTPALLLLLDVWHDYSTACSPCRGLRGLVRVARAAAGWRAGDDALLRAEVRGRLRALAVPRAPGPELVAWLFVSWTFSMIREFEHCAKVAITRGTRSVRLENGMRVPLAARIIGE